MSGLTTADAPGRRRPAWEPWFIRWRIAAGDFLAYAADNLTVGRPLPPELVPVVLPGLVERARALHDMCLDVREVVDIDGEYGEYLDQSDITYLTIYGSINSAFCNILYSLGFRGTWDGEPEGPDRSPLPGASGGIPAEDEDFKRFAWMLEALPCQDNPHDGSVACRECGAVHRPDAGDGPHDGPPGQAEDDHSPAKVPHLDSPAAPIAVPMPNFAAEFLADYRPRVARSTYKGVRTALSGMMGSPSVRTTADLTTANVSMYRDRMMERGLARSTIEGNLTELGTVCNFAIARGYLAENPVDSLDPRVLDSYAGPHDGGHRKPPPLASDDVTRLLIHLRDGSIGSWEGHRLFALAALLAMAGPPALTFGHAIARKVEDFDLAAGVLEVTGRVAAERRHRLPPKLVEVLGAWLPRTRCGWAFPGQRLEGFWNGGRRGMQPLHRIRAAGEAIGIERLTFARLSAFAEANPGGRTLGPEFLEAPIPAASDRGPDPGKPGVRPGGPPAVLWLPPRYDGRAKVRGEDLNKPITRGEDKLLRAMIEAGCRRGVKLGADELRELSGVEDPRRTLRELRKLPQLASIITIKGTRTGEGYGFSSE